MNGNGNNGNGQKFSRGESFSAAALMNKSTDHAFDAPGGIAFRLNPDAYSGGKNSAEREKVASFVNNWIQRTKDPASDIPGAPPLFGQDVVPQAMTFASKIGSQAKTYLPSDEALEANPNDALLMRKDLGIMECLEIRQRMSALLDWSIVPEDSKSPAQKSVAAELTKIVKRVKRFTEYKRCLMDAIWIGRSAIQHTYGHGNIGGKMYCYPRAKHADATGWKHIHGDKIVFRYDDGEKLANGAFPDQMGIRVSSVIQKDARIRGIQDLEYTNSGAAIFLSPAERQTIICHKHMIEDAEYQNPRKAGRIHGVGIRDRIYNEWFLKQEMLGFLMEYMERSAGGIEIYEYPSGDEAAKKSIMEAAKNRMAFGRNQIFFPKPLGMDAGVYDIRIVEPGFAGMDMLVNILDKYFGHRIKRYIIGQTLSTEADATGLGSSVADFQKDSLAQIVMYDSSNLEETLTHELVRPIHLANWPETESWQFELKLELESDNVKEKLDSYQTAWSMGLGIPEKDVAEAIGVSLDNPNEKMLKNAQAGGMGAGMGNGMQFPPGTGFSNQIDAAHEHVKAAGEVKAAKQGVIDHVAGKVNEGDSVGDGKATSAPTSADQYARQMSLWDEEDHPRDEEGKFVEKGDSRASSSPAETLPDGKVRMRQAKAGGETSDVDGKFYKGGRLMPVHGLYSGREKPSPKPKRENPFGSLPVASEDGKGLPSARKRTDEQIEQERREMQDKAAWLSVQSGPVRDMVWVGDKPGRTAYDVKKQLVPFLSGLTDEQVQQIGEFAFQSVIDHESEQYPDVDRETIESEFNGHAAYTADLLLSKKIRKEFPSMERTVEAIRQYSDLPDQLQRWVEMDEHLRDVLGAVGAEKYAREFNEADHPRDEAGKFTEKVNAMKARIQRMYESVMRVPAEQRSKKNIAMLNEAGRELFNLTGERLTKDGWVKDPAKPVVRNPQFRHASPEAQQVGNQFIVDHLGIKTAALSQDIAEGDWAHEFERQHGRRWEPDQYQRRSHRLLSEAASSTHTSPTPAQREAGNYAKGIFPWKGLEIAIENPKGSTRSGVSPSTGREWSRTMSSHYGYFRRTKANDGDNLDVFIGPHPDSEFVLVIKQVDQDGDFDEFKVVVGCLNRKEAKRLYLANYPKGWKCGPAASMTVELFKKWVEKGGPMKARSIKAEC